jgi:hypothetical protein
VPFILHLSRDLLSLRSLRSLPNPLSLPGLLNLLNPNKRLRSLPLADLRPRECPPTMSKL